MSNLESFESSGGQNGGLLTISQKASIDNISSVSHLADHGNDLMKDVIKESPKSIHNNAYLRTSENTPEEKEGLINQLGETAQTFLDIKENLALDCKEKLSPSKSDDSSSSSCSPFSSDSDDIAENEEMKETVKDTNFSSAPCRSKDLCKDNFGSLTL